MPRGGNQPPRRPAAVSGPGSASRRTDGGVQAVREPDIDSPDLQYGDRQALSDAQRIAGIANRSQPAGAGPERRPTGAPTSRGERLPSWLFEMDSSFPNEPGTAGLGMGPGPGPEALMASEPAPDLREQVLMFLAQNFGNEDAAEMLHRIREERQPAAPAMPTLQQPVAAA